MPSFCRHNRLIQNCPICAREQHVELRPVVSGGRVRTDGERERIGATGAGSGARARSGSRSSGRSSAGLTVRRLAREAGDGYRCDLVPGLKSGADAARLAEELAFAAARLAVLAPRSGHGPEPPGLYAEVADPAGDLEERTWLAFEIAYLGPLDEADPFAGIAQARTSWASGEAPALADARTGPRTGYDAVRGARTIDAYRSWAQRAGSQSAAIAGEASWTPERRFARVFERLGALATMDRGPRFDLLVTLGRLGVYDLRAGALHVGGDDRVTVAAKRILGIGDPLLLERRAVELAEACEVPLEALDLGFFNWERGARLTMGVDAVVEPDPVAATTARRALGLVD